MIKQAVQSFSLPYFLGVLWQNRKTVLMYVLFFMVIAFNLSFIVDSMHSPATEGLLNIVQLICFMLLGAGNTWYLCRRAFPVNFSFNGGRLAFVCLLFVMVTIMLLLNYCISRVEGFFICIASSAAFLCPHLVWEAWGSYNRIPAADYRYWQLPETVSTVIPAAYTGFTMLVQLKLARSRHHPIHNIYPVTAPGKLKLGRVFEKFIADQRQMGSRGWIETKDENDQFFGWYFFEYRWKGIYRRRLDPARSLLENGLRTNAVIIAERVSSEE
jgi:hypothetical protein